MLGVDGNGPPLDLLDGFCVLSSFSFFPPFSKDQFFWVRSLPPLAFLGNSSLAAVKILGIFFSHLAGGTWPAGPPAFRQKSFFCDSSCGSSWGLTTMSLPILPITPTTPSSAQTTARMRCFPFAIFFWFEAQTSSPPISAYAAFSSFSFPWKRGKVPLSSTTRH